jgi:hypothetical protein
MSLLALKNADEVWRRDAGFGQIASGIRERPDRQIRHFLVEAGQERVRRLPSQTELLQLLRREVAQFQVRMIEAPAAIPAATT